MIEDDFPSPERTRSHRGVRSESEKPQPESTFQDDFEPPDHLPESAKAIWWKTVREAPKDHFRYTDLPMLALYCEAYATHKEACEQLSQEGMVILDEKGNPRENPWVNIRQRASRTMNMVATKLRLTPQSRYAESAEAKKKAERGTEKPSGKSKREGLKYEDGKITSIRR